MAKFFKRNIPSKGVYPNAVYSDLYDNNKNTTDIQAGSVSGIDNAAFVIGDYTLPSKPSFGDAEMVGAKLGFYINSITQGGSGGTAGLKSFNVGVDIGGTEGGKSSAGSLINNQDIVQICSYHNEEEGYILEDFSNDGFEQDVKETKEMTLLKKVGPYLEEKVGYEKGQNYGLATGFGFGSAPTSQETHKKRFGYKQEDGSYIYKLEKEKQWGKEGWKSIKKHGNWWRRNEEWWKNKYADGSSSNERTGVRNDIKYHVEVTVDIPPEDRPTELNTDNSFFDTVKQTETFRSVVGDSNTLKREHYAQIIHDTKNNKTGGGALGLNALYTHRNNADSSPQYGTYNNPTKIVSGLPTSTAVAESTLQQVAFASKLIPMPIDCGNSQTPMRAARGTHAPVPTIELDLNFAKMAPMFKRNERTDASTTVNGFKFRLNRSVCITFGALKPSIDDNLYSYVKRHLPLIGEDGDTSGNGNAEPMHAAIALKCTDGDLANSNGMAEKDYIMLTDADGVKRFYVFCDSGESGTQPSTGTVMTSSSDTGASTLGSTFANAGTCIAVTVDLTTATQGEILNELRTAITHANGHNGSLRCGSAHNASNSVDFNANGNQFLHITQAVGGKAGNSSEIQTTYSMTGSSFGEPDFAADIGDAFDFVRSRDTTVSNSTDFVGGVDCETFFGSAFVANSDGELCHKSLEGEDISASTVDASFKVDDDLGEVCVNTEPSTLGDGSALNQWLKVSYQMHPDSYGTRMSIYEPSSGEFIQKPHLIKNCRSENLNGNNSGSVARRVARYAVNRDKPAKFMTIWLNNYQAVKGQWDSSKQLWKTGLKVETDGDGSTKTNYIDDPSTGEKAEGGDVKSQAWQLIKPKTSIKLAQDSDEVVRAVSTIDRTATADGFLQLTIDSNADTNDDQFLGYDGVNQIDEFVSKGNEDMEILATVDAIAMKKFNILHNNATPADNNPFPQRLEIPPPSNIIPFNYNLNLSNSDVDNIKDFRTYQPSYISFGFNDWYDLVGSNSETTKVMFADAKKLLMNDFQMPINTSSSNIIVNPDSRYSHVRAGYTSHEDYGMQCRNKMSQNGSDSTDYTSSAQAIAGDNLEAGYHSTITDTERTEFNLISQVFDNAAGTPTFTKAGLKVGSDSGTVGTDHDISIGTSSAGQIDYFSQKGILEWKFSPRTTASGSTIANAGSGDLEAGDTNVTVTNGAHFEANQFIKATGSEIMKITSISGNVLNLERGQYGTTDSNHSYGQALSLVAAPEKRENIFCSSRILKLDNNTITVDDVDILKLKSGEEFIIYKYGDSHASPEFTPIIGKVVRIDNDREVILDVSPSISVDDETQYLISPYRYWLIMEIVNVGGEVTKTVTSRASGNTQLTLSDVDGLKVYQQIKGTSITITAISGNVVTVSSDAGAIDSVTFEAGTWQGNNNTFVRKLLPKKSYKNVVGISEKGTYGTTLNESLYNDGAYINSWNLEAFEDSGESAIILKDYGFGGFDEEKGLGGHAGVLPLNIQSDINKFKEIDVSGVIETENPDFGDTLTLLTATDNPDESFKINVDTETGTNPMYLLTELKDPIMSKPELSISPDKDNAFYPKLKWSSPDKDAWYGFIIVDDKNIENQYANAVIHYPFNESGSHGTAASAPVEKISGHATTITGALYDVEGLAGNCLRFDGVNNVVTCTPSPAADPTYDGTADTQTEMSVVAHIVPDADISGENIIISQYDDNTKEKFKITLNASKQIEAVVVMKSSPLVNATLTSSSLIVTDGETPTSIILTVDTTLKSGNVKLFINGKLEDLTGASLAAGTSNNWQTDTVINGGNASLHIGRSASTSGNYGFDGKIEEVVVYKKCIYPVVPNVTEFLFTKPVSELTSGQSLAQSKSHTAKLFIKDYHNIRGSTEEEVASSSQVSWRKAGFALDTS